MGLLIGLVEVAGMSSRAVIPAIIAKSCRAEKSFKKSGQFLQGSRAVAGTLVRGWRLFFTDRLVLYRAREVYEMFFIPLPLNAVFTNIAVWLPSFPVVGYKAYTAAIKVLPNEFSFNIIRASCIFVGFNLNRTLS